jgi:hypothetical protein
MISPSSDRVLLLLLLLRAPAHVGGVCLRARRPGIILHGIFAPGTRQLPRLLVLADQVQARAVPAYGQALVALLLALPTGQAAAALSRVAALFGRLALLLLLLLCDPRLWSGRGLDY